MNPVTTPDCRFCGTSLRHTMVDLGMSPLCESFLLPEQTNRAEAFYPLHVYVCHECLLVQLEEYVSPAEIFDDYAYFSSYSDAWLEHSEKYVNDMIERLDLDTGSMVVEVASNDGYLLQYFVDRGIPCLGIEPAHTVAEAAIAKGLETRMEFFDLDSATAMGKEGIVADLVVGNNVLAQVPNLNSFVAGFKEILAEDGVVTLEFPHLLRLMEENQFDTIYHEHFSYFSLHAAQRIFAAHGLTLFDVEELWTHGGSLRLFLRHEQADGPIAESVPDLLERERLAGLLEPATYERFGAQVEATKRALLKFLIDTRESGKSIAAYGAPGKGNTLLNYCGIRTDFLDYAADRNPYKHGRVTPGTHIPIFPPERIAETKPDFVLILPWNLRDEIVEQLAYVRDWGGRFVVPIPRVEVID